VVHGEGKFIVYSDVSDLQVEGNDTVYGYMYKNYKLRYILLYTLTFI